MNGLGWYNENEFRDYPFLARVDDGGPGSALAAYLPQAAIVDFGAILAPDAGFTDGTDYLYLESIRHEDGGGFLFDIHSTSGGHCLFHRTLTDPEFTVTWEEALADTALSSSSRAAAVPRWRAFLVTGRLEDLAELLSPGQAVYFAPGFWKVEPARVQNPAQSQALRFHLANKQRLLWTAPAGCPGTPAVDPNAVHVVARDLTGDLLLEEGFQASLRQEDQNRAIAIGAGLHTGEGPPCGEVPRYHGEAPPAGSPFLTGGPACNELVKRINGVGGRAFKLTGQGGVTVTPDPDLENTLLVTLDTNAFNAE